MTGLNVLLIDADAAGKRALFPNLALMKLAAWYRAQGALVTLFPHVWFPNLVYVSTVFSWNRPRAEAFAELFPGARLGGSGMDLSNKLPTHIETLHPDYQLYDIDYGMGFLTRGCPRCCPFCIVPEKEGNPRVAAALDDVINPRSNFVVLLDNNFLAFGDWSKATLEEMIARDLVVNFSQGLDIRFVTPEIAHLLARVNFRNTHNTKRRLTFAFDHIGMERTFREKVQVLIDAGIKPCHLQVFILCGFDSTFEEDMHRIRLVQGLEIDPYVMVYRDPASGEKNPDRRLRHLARWVNARLWRNVDWREYKPWIEECAA